ncbi:MAG: WYL domain-containing protein, partial [Oscillospiraceae bacterium]
ISSYRLDNILSATHGETCDRFDHYRNVLNKMQDHIWGVSTKSHGERLEHIDFTVRYGADEAHIHRRLEREKRCGTVEKIDEYSSRFSANVYDSGEIVPWIRTFICRIIEIHCSNAELEKQFKEDMDGMYRLYGLNGGDAQ